jgi:hypothetical protein
MSHSATDSAGRRKSRRKSRRGAGQDPVALERRPYRVSDGEIAFWRRRFARVWWAVFESGTVVKLADAATADEAANRAITTLSGFGCDLPETPASIEWTPGEGRERGAWWVVTLCHRGGASVCAFAGAGHARTADAAWRLVADRLRNDQDCLRIASIASA